MEHFVMKRLLGFDAGIDKSYTWKKKKTVLVWKCWTDKPLKNC